MKNKRIEKEWKFESDESKYNKKYFDKTANGCQGICNIPTGVVPLFILEIYCIRFRPKNI